MSSEVPIWERRFRAPQVSFPRWARGAPERLVLTSDESGARQVYAWDRAAGGRRRVTDEPIGVTGGWIDPAGGEVVWFQDATGDEVGRWVAEPFAGGRNQRRVLLDGVPDAWSAGMALGDGVVVAATTDADGEYRVYASRDRGPALELHRGQDYLELGELSADGRLAVLAHAEHGDVVHLAARVIDVASGATVADLWDGDGLGLHPGEWSPVPGDPRVVVVHEREGRLRPALWNASTGERHDVAVDLPGDVTVAGWWPDASALLLVHAHEGRDQLLRLDAGEGPPTAIDHPEGTLHDAGVRPDGEVWFRASSGHRPPWVGAVGGGEVVAAEGERAPEGRPYRSWHFPNPSGQRVHGFLVEPDGRRPHPVVMLVHGGPHAHWSDSWRPEVQAWADHGFLVALVNYRGSTGYGPAWRDVLNGNPGLPELEDTVAGLDALVAEGMGDPTRVVLAGRSWGGYVALLGLGRHPHRWLAGVAGVPVADYVAAFEDEAPGLQALDVSLFGGTPAEVPHLYRERSPITYVDEVRAPVLVYAGDNDSRCPLRQVLNYAARLTARAADCRLYRYDAGHGSMVVDERVRHMRWELDFVTDRMAAASPPGAA